MSECEDCLQIMKERDLYSDKADELAQAIAEHFEVKIGEHSSANNPWENALDWIFPSRALKTSSDRHVYYCGNCTRKLNDYWNYCPNCGQRLNWSSPFCGNQTD